MVPDPVDSWEVGVFFQEVYGYLWRVTRRRKAGNLKEGGLTPAEVVFKKFIYMTFLKSL